MPIQRDWLAYCLGKPGAWRDEPWENDVVAKVGDKIFAFFGNLGDRGPESISVKCCDREAADLWLERYPEAARKMPYLGGHGWNTFTLDATLPEDELEELVDESYAMVVAKLPRKKRPVTS